MMTSAVRSLCGALCLALLTGLAWAGKLPDTIIYSPEVLGKTKQRVLERDRDIMPAYAKLIEQADRALKEPAETVIFKPAPPPGGDQHDYWSLSPYWWPNPDSRTGLPYVRRDGKRNPAADSDTYDRARMRRMSSEALTLALAWYLTENEEYAGKATALIWSWCCDSVTRTTPHMEFARAIPGISHGTHAGIIETRDLIKVVEAAQLLEPSRSWSKVVSKKVKKWFGDYVLWLQKSPLGRQEAMAADTHGTWFDAQLAVYTLYIGKKNLARSIIGSLTPRRIAMQIEHNGAIPLELARKRSRHATFFALEAFFTLAAVGDRVGIDIWQWADPTGLSIRKAFDYAAPYLATDEPWPFGTTGNYDPFMFTPLFHRAAMVYKDARYSEFLKALPADRLKQDRAQLFY